MKLLAVAYPVLSENDYDLIEKFRSQYDPQFSIIRPHFTLVFPVEGLDEYEFADYAGNILGRESGFNFCLTKAIVYKNDLSENFYSFLVPDEGNEQIKNLHTNLYEGTLEAFLWKDIPYTPHLTIGARPNERECVEITEAWNKMNLEIHGGINAVDVLSFEDGEVSTIERVKLL